MKRKKLAALGLVMALTASNSTAVLAADALNIPDGTAQQAATNTEETQKAVVIGTENNDLTGADQEVTKTDGMDDVQTGTSEADESTPTEDTTGGVDVPNTSDVTDSVTGATGDSNNQADTDGGNVATSDTATPEEDTTEEVTDQTEAEVPEEEDGVDEAQIAEDQIALYADAGIALYVALPSSIGGVSTNSIVNATKVTIRKYEGSYTSVNPNDNGRLSVGKMQWNGDRAKSLLKLIVVKNTQNARTILGDSLYGEILNNNTWNKRILNTDETAKIKALLGTNESIQAQDEQEDSDVRVYINHIYNAGIRNAAAVLYLADVENQSGSGSVNTILSYAKNLGSVSSLTLNDVHIATICYSYTNRNSWLSASDANRKSYITRRIKVYTDASSQGWTYCNSGDYRMPSTSPQSSKIGVQWLQNALNQYQNAGLDVDGSYGPGTKQAVKNFQESAKLSVDGDAGVDTIRELVRRLYYNKVINGNNSIINDGNTTTKVIDVVWDGTNWVYTVNGKTDTTFTGFAKNSSGWWYIEKGKVNFNKNGVIQGTVNGETAWWHVSGGNVKFDNSVETNGQGWYCIQNGKINFSFNGFAKNWCGWWYIENGKVDFNKNGVIYGTVNGETAWWHVKGGFVEMDNSVEANEFGWWCIRNGKVDFSYNGFAKNWCGWWYIQGGNLDFNVNGVFYGTVNGEAAWWYVNGGNVKLNFNGIGKNQFGWWYIKNGKVDFSANGWKTINGKKYYVEAGFVKL